MISRVISNDIEVKMNMLGHALAPVYKDTFDRDYTSPGIPIAAGFVELAGALGSVRDFAMIRVRKYSITFKTCYLVTDKLGRAVVSYWQQKP